MFLSKLPNGIYHIYYFKENGKKSKVSTHTKLKSEAYKFLTNFEQEIKSRKENKLSPIELRQFSFEFLVYSESIHSWNNAPYLTLSEKVTKIICS